MKSNYKGFTLIELLAVIVVLAIIALIAIPILLNVIDKAKIGALKDSAYGIIDSAEIYLANNLNNEIKSSKFNCSNNKCISDDKEITYKGNINKGILVLDKSGKITICVDNGSNYALKLTSEKTVAVGKGTCGSYQEENGTFEIEEELSTKINELEQKYDNLKSTVDSLLSNGVINYTFSIANSNNTLDVEYNGTYKVELWGAQGEGNYGGLGSYTSGLIDLKKGNKLFINIGGRSMATSVSVNDDLKSRVMVAAAGGKQYSHDECGHGSNTVNGGAGGGLIGYNGYSGKTGTALIRVAQGGTQTAGGIYGYGNEGSGNSGAFGIAGTGIKDSSAGGTGWYGGGGSGRAWCNGGSGAGGSSYISGHNGSIGINEDGTPKSSTADSVEDSYSYTNFKFRNTVMIDGAGYNWSNVKETQINMPTYDGKSSMVGNSGTGYAKITLVSLY